jgi:hypothetical protein
MSFEDGDKLTPAETRRRVVLKPVAPLEATGLIIPYRRDARYRGYGEADYLCGSCGSLLCIGVRPGMFQCLAFACGCGTLNQVQ